MKHALVAGGTGMLAGVSLWLLEKGYHVSVIARNPERMEQLIEKTNFKNNLTPVLVDYRNSEELQAHVNAAIKKNGPIDLVVAWIHSDAPDALTVIINAINANREQWKLFHILGSSANIKKIKRTVPVPHGCTYYQVQLGFIIENGRSRWLTHEEIAGGVITAIQRKKPIYTIGQLEPWEQRP